MNLNGIMLSERSQFQMVLYSMIPFIGHSGKGKTTEKKVRLNGCPLVGVGRMYYYKQQREFGGHKKTSLYLDYEGGYTSLHVLKLMTLYTKDMKKVNMIMCNFLKYHLTVFHNIVISDIAEELKLILTTLIGYEQMI